MAEQTVQGIVLFRRDTSADWETNRTGVPKDGEPCWNSETHELRVGDGVTAYENLPVIGANAGSTATHYEGTREGDETDAEVIERVLSGASPNKDDIFVVKTLISGDKYSFTAYVYNGTAWAAMDGNYNAENVYFDEDLLTTSEIGNITLTNGQATIPSDTVCYPAKLMHGHIDALLRMGADTIFYPCMSYNFDEQLGDNHFNCPVVAYYPEVAAANIRPLRDVRFIYDYLDLSDPKRFAKKAVSVFRRSFDGLTAREIRSAADAAYAEYAAYTAQVRRKGEEALEEARRRGLPVIVLCGRPYHLDAEINHGIDELIRSMGAVVISEDALGGLLHRAETGVLNQWTYHARLYAAAEFVCARSAEQPIDLVQLVSFGCGIDAITTDEMRRILESHGKIYTQIKIDEITNLGAVRIRLRSLFSALDDTRKGGGQKQP